MVGAGSPSAPVPSCTSTGTLSLKSSASPHGTTPSSVVPAFKEPSVAVPDLGGAIIGFTMAFPTTVSGAGALVTCGDCYVVDDSPGSAVTRLTGFTSVASTSGTAPCVLDSIHTLLASLEASDLAESR